MTTETAKIPAYKRQKVKRCDAWYERAKAELRLMELLDAAPSTRSDLAAKLTMPERTVAIMLYGLRLAECVGLDRKTGIFYLLPPPTVEDAQQSQQLALELGG